MNSQLEDRLEDYAERIEKMIQTLQNKDDLAEAIIVVKTYSGDKPTLLVNAASDTCAITAAKLLHIVGSQK